MGGLPRIGDLAWPSTADGRLMSYLCGISLDALSRYGAESGLPETGRLHVFGDADRQASGTLDGEVQEIFVHLEVPGDREVGWHGGPEFVFDEVAFEVTERLDLALPSSARCDGWGLSPFEQLKYEEFYTRWSLVAYHDGPNHKLLGYPSGLTSSFEWEPLLAGSQGYADLRRHLAAGLPVADNRSSLDDWVMLFQLASDPGGVGWCWGLDGYLYAWIHKRDLRDQRFDRVWATVVDC